MSNIFSENREAGTIYREQQLTELLKFMETMGKDVDHARRKFFCPDYTSLASFQESIDIYREKFMDMLGWPLCDFRGRRDVPEAEAVFVAEDDLGKIYRLNIAVLNGLSAYGLLFLPKGDGPHPLMISQHGGGGTPELCSGFFGSGNYNDMTRRVLKKGFAVFAPQLVLWSNEFGPAFERVKIDNRLKQFGSSITALEIYKLMRCLDYLSSREDIDENRIGMIGLSYGGFYTMFTAACDVRIKAALSSCFFNNRLVYNWQDWTWFNSANTFLDAEICSLICPRSLYIEVAKNDELFDVKYTYDEYQKVRYVYDKIGYSGNLRFKAFEGVHELDKSDDGIDFLFKKIM